MISQIFILTVGSFLFALTAFAQPVVTEAVPISGPKAVFPKEAREKGFGGTVNVPVTVNERGIVTEVGEAVGPDWVCPQYNSPEVLALHNSAKAAAWKTKFKPATQDGKPVAATASVSFTFDLPKRDDKIGAAVETKYGVQRVSSDDTAGSKNLSTAKIEDPQPQMTLSGGSPVSPVVAESVDAAIRSGALRGGVLNGKALNLVKPPYPPAARAVKASGMVNVQVTIDENGDMLSAVPVSGHPLLRNVSRIAACNSKFSPTLLSGQPVKVTGIIIYNFHTQ